MDSHKWARTSKSRLQTHTQTLHIRQKSSGRVIGPPQRPLPALKTTLYETHIHGPGRFRTRNPKKRAAAEWRHFCTIGCTVRDMTRGQCEGDGKCTQLTDGPEEKAHKLRFKNNIKKDLVAVGWKTS